MHKFISTLLFISSILFASTFEYNGLLQSPNGHPIQGARVLSLQTGKETATDSLGRFGNYEVSISGVAYKENLLRPVVDKNILYYSSSVPGENVSVKIFDLKGRILLNKKSASRTIGINKVLLNSTNSLGSGLYIVNFTIGRNTFNLKTVISDLSIRNVPQMHLTKENKSEYRNNSRVLGEDTLFINAGGYKDTIVIPQSIDVGIITLNSVSIDSADIEFNKITLAYNTSNFPKMRKDTVLLNISLKNSGLVNALSVKCSLSTMNSDIQIINNISGYNNIIKDESQNGENPFKLRIPRDFPAGKSILFDLQIVDSWGGQWRDKISYVPYPFIVSMQKIDDDDIPDSYGNGDSKVSPGEIIEYTPQIQNVLGEKVDSVYGELMSDYSINVSASDNIWAFNDIDTLEKKLPELDYVFSTYSGVKIISSKLQADMIISCKIKNSVNSFLLPLSIDAENMDTDPPVITINGNNPDTIYVGDSWTMPMVSALDNVDGDITSNIEIAGSVNTAKVGKNSIICSVSDAAGNISKKTLLVFVIEKENKPQLILKGPESLIISLGSSYVDSGFTVIDTNGDTLPESISKAVVAKTLYNSLDEILDNTYNIGSELGTFNIKFTLSYNGSSVTKWRYIYVTGKDTVPPVITLLGDVSTMHLVNTAYIDLGATAIDDADGDISDKVQTLGINFIDTTKEGTYLIGYFVNDNAGNASDTLKRYVFIINNF